MDKFDFTKLDINQLNKILEQLTPKEKELALSVLKEYANEGHSKLLDNMILSDFDESPVDIHTFLHDKKYLGNALYDEGRFTIFPYWEKTLKEIFPDNISTRYNTIIFTGAIGLGKSTIAVIILLYLLHRLLCLKDPYNYYGLQPIDKISISFMNITLENAKGVAMDKMNQMILSSEWFLQHGSMAGTVNLEYRPNKHIELIAASSNNQVIGRALYGNFTDECLDGDTLILTREGYIKIKDLENKCLSLPTYNPETKQLEYSEPCYIRNTTTSNEYYSIELEDGTVLKCTPTHKFLLKDGTYKYAKDLLETDELEDSQFDSNSNMDNDCCTYDEFIQNIINTRGQWNIPEGEYFESHHIIPRCLGGTGERQTKHPNIIWLYPDEHYRAHKLLAQEHPDVYGLQAAFTFTSVNGRLKEEDYSELKKLRHQLPDTIEEKITDLSSRYFKKRFKKRKNTRRTNRDVTNYKLEIQKRISEGNWEWGGEKNGMYGKGYLISGGNNGHANIRYFFKDHVFECRKELICYLHNNNIKITNSALKSFMTNKITLRGYNMYKEVFDNLTWRYKDEDY